MTARARLLIVNPGAGAVTDAVMERLRREFPECEVVHFPPDSDQIRSLPGRSLVIACGGDGTIAAVARRLAGTTHAFGVVPMGTFNNFARSLDLPTELDAAIGVIKTGQPRGVTIGQVNGNLFLEAAAIGLFGDSIALGEAAKDLHYGEVLDALAAVASGQRFPFRVSGDVELSGEAVTIVVANTPYTGARMPVGETTPEMPYLDLAIDGGTKLGVPARVLEAVVRGQPPKGVQAYRVRHVRIETDPPMHVHADAARAGSTPADIEAIPNGLTVILP
ncbi:MAG TPA: diacylglycerol kinase family protein [Candidatus Dormibacteraeota bacterium]